MSGTENKVRNFGKAIHRLQESIDFWNQNKEWDVVRDGVIQRFEFTYELAWKATKVILEQSGVMDANSPKAVIREAYAQRLITDEDIWLNIISDRNLTSHVYKEEMADEIVNRISSLYLSAFKELYQKITEESQTQ
jgi:nucleotidyltransferase substrate binding protein (TIGR01987 family)